MITEDISKLTIGQSHSRNSRLLESTSAFQAVDSNSDSPLHEEHRNVSSSSLWMRRTINSTYDFTDSIFGTISSTSRQSLSKFKDTNDWSDEHEENESSYTISPAAWLRFLGLSRAFRIKVSKSSVTGWQYSLQTFSRVKDDALIFNFCRQGNIDAVRSLFAASQASVRDIDSEGRTPLWVCNRPSINITGLIIISSTLHWSINLNFANFSYPAVLTKGQRLMAACTKPGSSLGLVENC